jgi:hypothetical protein
MADREMIAATLAAALVEKRGPLSVNEAGADIVVQAYQLILAALDKAQTPGRAPYPANHKPRN